MADVTEADREKARELLDTAPLLDLGGAIAVALAEEREKARAPFLALADAYSEIPDDMTVFVDTLVKQIRRAAGEG